jgi:hypothetical protein
MRIFRGASILRLIVLLLVFGAIAEWAWRHHVANRPVRTKFSVHDRLDQYGAAADARVKPYFDAAGANYPPSKLVMVGLKEERQLQLYAPGPDGALKFIHTYKVLAASGFPGPKLMEGDQQVPEGIYNIDSLNPNSLYHLALRVGYPNDWDKQHGATDGRKDLGGDIMIHGADGSIGCLAMGDRVSEDIFILAARTGIENIQLILSPVDFRTRALPSPMPSVPPWTSELYANIKSQLATLPIPNGN